VFWCFEAGGFRVCVGFEICLVYWCFVWGVGFRSSCRRFKIQGVWFRGWEGIGFGRE
jgi:hypothetical protein